MTGNIGHSARRLGALAAALITAVWIVVGPIPADRPTSAAAQRPWNDRDLWLQAGGSSVPLLGGAAAALAAGNAKAALPAFTQAANHSAVGIYARLYQGRAELILGRIDLAATSANRVIGAAPRGALRDAARWLLADAHEQAGKWRDAARVLRDLIEDAPATSLANPASAYLRYGRASFKSDDATEAARAFERVYLDYPLSPEADDAESNLRGLFRFPPPAQTFERAERRADVLFAGRRYDDARRAFEDLLLKATAADRPRIELRLAECDFYLKRYLASRDRLRSYLQKESARLDEASYFDLSAARVLKRESEYFTLVRRLVDAYPASPYAEMALNDLATYHILANDDERAVGVFREMVRLFPTGAYGDRAAWRVGWWAYRQREYAEAIRQFDAAAVNFPRADYRPSWLYWSARANQKLGRVDAAASGYRKTVAFYRNSYYGREATRLLTALGPKAPIAVSSTPLPGGPPPTGFTITPGVAPPNAPLIQALLSAGLYDDAIEELKWVQRQSGSTPFLEASIAYALNRKGELRPAITAMRRAYPQFMAEGGELLPAGLLKVIFPIDHWELIRHYAGTRNLDPYLVTALVAQESTFQADVRSSANAWGLMQVIPATGRRYAPLVGVRRFTTAQLTNPDVNVRIGTAVFSDLMKQFNDPAVALAGYNAGENRAARWRAERPGVDRDEFIDDIPFPETQNYVKRIIGTAEDYRLLYAGASAAPARDVRQSGR